MSAPRYCACGELAAFVAFHGGTSKPRAFVCAEHAPVSDSAELGQWLREWERYQVESQAARDAVERCAVRAVRRLPRWGKKRKRVGTILHALAEIPQGRSRKGRKRGYWVLFRWDLNKAYETMIALDANAHEGWPKDASDQACELEEDGEADEGQQWVTLAELRDVQRAIVADDAEELLLATLHVRTIIAALEAFARPLGIEEYVRVLFYRA